MDHLKSGKEMNCTVNGLSKTKATSCKFLLYIYIIILYMVVSWLQLS